VTAKQKQIIRLVRHIIFVTMLIYNQYWRTWTTYSTNIICHCHGWRSIRHWSILHLENALSIKPNAGDACLASFIQVASFYIYFQKNVQLNTFAAGWIYLEIPIFMPLCNSITHHSIVLENYSNPQNTRQVF